MKINLGFLKKYNVNYNKIIGFEKKESFINNIYEKDINNSILDNYNFYSLFIKQKVIRKERNINLYPKHLVSTYLDLSLLSVYSIDIDENLFHTINNIEDYIETKLYQEFGTNNKFIFKYNILKYKNQSKYNINVIFIKYDYIEKYYIDLLKKIGYIDYITVPFLSYKFLYKEDIISSSNIDLFIIFQWDKTFITIYDNKKFVTNIVNYEFNLNNIYEKLKNEFDIEDFEEKTFYKLLNKKGLDSKKYSKYEFELRDFLQYQIEIDFKTFLIPEIEKILNEFKLSDKINNIFITTDKVNIHSIESIENNIKKYFLNIKDINISSLKILSFNFLDTYNLDKLPVSPFLFLSMLECYYSFKENDFSNNISIWKRQPNFLYRPLGKFLAANFLFTLIFFAGLGILNYKTNQFNIKIKKLQNKLSKLTTNNVILSNKINNNFNKLEKKFDILNKNKQVLNYNISLVKEIENFNNYYKVVIHLYDFISYLYKSKVKILSFKLEKTNILNIDIISDKKENIVNLLKLLTLDKNIKILNEFLYINEVKNNKLTFWKLNLKLYLSN